MRRFFRRKKKLIIRLTILLAIIIFIVLLVLYILPKAGITTIKKDVSNSSEEVDVTIIEEPQVKVSLPEYITTVDDKDNLGNVQTPGDNSNTIIETTTGTNGKSYTSYVNTEEKYFITVLSNDNKKLTIMLSNKAKDLLSNNSKAKIGIEYSVSNIKEEIVGVYDFTYSNYKYPILLLLSASGKLYYVDLESALSSGNFKAEGPIKNISNIYKVVAVEVKDGDNTYKSAVITDLDEIGYEFTLDMIGR